MDIRFESEMKMNETYEPTSAAGKWKREQYQKYSEITGMAWCSAGQHFAKAETVKRYKGMQRHSASRCDVCNAKRTKGVKVK